MKLVRPSIKYEESWLKAMEEFKPERDEENSWKCLTKTFNIKKHLKRLKKYEKGKENSKVPSSTYWLIDNSEFIGHVNIRHHLNNRLKKIGGHIGYEIRPSKRKLGYGTKILKLALEKTKKLGIEKTLVMCNPENTGSRKIIEKNGGIFDKEIEFEGEKLQHYWIPNSQTTKPLIH